MSNAFVAQTPCEWCGAAIEHPHRGGRRRRYCGRSCRQRAYELRTAEARLDRDLAAGAVRAVPADRVLEVERPAPPRPGGNVPYGTGWVPLLGTLTEQLRAGRMPPAAALRVADALADALQAAMDVPAHRTPPPAPSPPPAAPTAPSTPTPLGLSAAPPPGAAPVAAGNRAQRRAAKKRKGH